MEKCRKVTYIISTLLIIISFAVYFPISVYQNEGHQFIDMRLEAENRLESQKMDNKERLEKSELNNLKKLERTKGFITYDDLEAVLRFNNLRSKYEIFKDVYGSSYFCLRDNNTYDGIEKVGKDEISRIEFYNSNYYLVKEKTIYKIKRKSFEYDKLTLELTKDTFDEYYELYDYYSSDHSTSYNTELPEKYYNSNKYDFIRNENRKNREINLKFDIIFYDFKDYSYYSRYIRLTDNSSINKHYSPYNIYAGYNFGLYDVEHDRLIFEKDTYSSSWYAVRNNTNESIYDEFLTSSTAGSLLIKYFDKVYIDKN